MVTISLKAVITAATGSFLRTDARSDGNGKFETNGLICRRQRVDMGAVKDGLSNTIMIGEVSGLWPGGNESKLYGAADGSGNPNDTNRTVRTGQYAPNGGKELTSGDRPGNWGFTSEHKGGVQFTFGDGSVKFISENISHILGPDESNPPKYEGCEWDSGNNNECDAGNSSAVGEYDVKSKLQLHFGTFQRLHSRNDALVIGEF